MVDIRVEEIKGVQASFRSRIQETPSSTRIPLWINQTEVGHLDKDLAKLFSDSFRFFSLEKDALFFTSSTDQLNQRLAVVSQFLKQNGLVFAWRDELLPIVPLGSQEPIPSLGMIERAVCRTLGLTTFAVHLNPHTLDGKIWVAQRSQKKAINPGKWDNCAAGTLSYGETFDLTMDREAFEEAGIHPGSYPRTLTEYFTLSRKVPEGWMIERTAVYTATVPNSFYPKNQDGEVSDFKLLTPKEIINLIKNDQFTFESAVSVLSAIIALQH